MVYISSLHTSSIFIDRYSNFGNTNLSKEFARVLGPGQIIDFFENYNRHTHSRSHTRSYTRRGKFIVGNISKRKR